MVEIVNLNKARKRLLREAEQANAASNRVRHGRTRAERDRERQDTERARRTLDGAEMPAEVSAPRSEP